jgi:hypothetical protein
MFSIEFQRNEMISKMKYKDDEIASMKVRIFSNKAVII